MNKQKQVVFVDVDDTISDTQRHFLAQINNGRKNPYIYEELTLAYREGADKEYDDLVRAVLKEPEIMAQTIPYPDALAAIEHLHANGYEIHIVSSRQHPLHEVTAQWLKRHGFADFVEHIHPRPRLVEGKKFKRNAAERVRPVAAFDDTLDVSLEMAKAGVDIYLIDKPWNRIEAPLPTNVHRVDDFAAGVNLFLQREKGAPR